MFFTSQLTLLGQDVSLTNITASDTEICLNETITIEIEISSTVAVDLQTSSLTIYMTGSNTLALTKINLNDPKFNFGPGSVTLTIPSDAFITEISSLTFSNYGITTFTASLTLSNSVTDTNSVNNFIQEQITVVEPNTPVISSSTGNFSFCQDDTITFTASGGIGSDNYYWKFGSSSPTLNSISVTKNPGELIDGEIIQLYLVTSEGCSSTIVSEVISVSDIPETSITSSLPGNTLCSGDDFTLTLSQTNYQSGTTTFSLVYGTNTKILSSTTGSVTTTISGLTSQTLITVTTENGDGCSSTDSITVYVPKLDNAGTIATAASTILCSGQVLAGNITSTATASLAAGSSTATIEYEWQFLSTATPTWTKIPGSTNSSTLTTNTLSNLKSIVILRLED